MHPTVAFSWIYLLDFITSVSDILSCKPDCFRRNEKLSNGINLAIVLFVISS
jgi:hypothetical protein